MFKLRSSTTDDAVFRVLKILANVADITEPRKYIFDPKNLIFKPKKLRKKQVHWETIYAVLFLLSFLALTLLSLLMYKQNGKLISPWSLNAMIILFFLGIGIGSLLLLAIRLTVILSRSWKQNEVAGKMIVRATEDAIAYQPIVEIIYASVKGDLEKIKSAESIIKRLLIEESQIREKSFTNFIPILSCTVVLLLWLIPIHLPGSNSFYNSVITIVGLGTLVLPMWKFITELDSQSRTTKFNRCLFILEQAQRMPNNTTRQATAATSTKGRPQFGSAAGLIQMSDDFNAPFIDSQEYM